MVEVEMIYEQLTLYDEVNMDGKDCEACGKGTYQTADVCDEFQGTRHCNKCGHWVKVWREVWP
jgi:hypothetical protein